MLTTILKQNPLTGELQEDNEKKARFIADIAPLKNGLEDEEIVMVYFAGRDKNYKSELTIAYFYGWEAAQNNGKPIYSHTVSGGGETISKIYNIDTETVRGLLKTPRREVLYEVVEQLIESRDPAYDAGIWFSHDKFGRSCFFEGVSEL